jgi:hypothetical protein
MSLAPQRPNFVLVWIGIILLTFSLISNFLAKPATNADSTAGGRAGVARSLVLEEESPLPGFQNAESALTQKVNSEQRNEQLIPFSLPFVNEVQSPLAKDGMATTLEDRVDFPVELLEPAVRFEEQLRSAEGVGIGGSVPTPVSSNHSLQSPTSHKGSQSHDGAGANSGVAGSLKSTYGGFGRDLQLGKHGLRGVLDTHGPGVAVKTKLVKSSNHNTVIVSFFVSHPNASDKLQNHLEGRSLNPKIVAMAREYMQAVQDTQESESEEDLETQENSQNEFEDAPSLRRELMLKLRQLPGGLEIIAEMTPAQLRELANKLDARSQKLRALVN